jgi:drug/metabolite transporter (DMT)-like permease
MTKSLDDDQIVKIGEEHEHVESAECTSSGFFTFVIGLISGTFSALCCKFAYDTASTGIDGTEKTFAKPIMMLLLMFFAMCPAGLFWLIQQWSLPPSQREHVSSHTIAILAIPSICDLLCTLLLLVAQLYITASLWQMMRGSIIIITALLKSFALNHRLRIHMWLGVSIITIAMILVASTAFFGGNTDSVSEEGEHVKVTEGKDPRVGVMLVVVGCLAQGVQYVFEEKVMNVNNAPPLVVIGCEGLWGTILTLILVYPLAYYLPGQDNGHFEDPFDAIMMIQNSHLLKLLVVFFVLTVTVYNCAAVYVTKYLSAIWHAILDNFRPITIWGFGLMIHSFGSMYGEVWTHASWLQFAGLIVLLFGTAVYNGSIIVFNDDGTSTRGSSVLGSEYDRISTSEEGLGSSSGGASSGGQNRQRVESFTDKMMKNDPTMASPALSRSPLIHQQLLLKAEGMVSSPPLAVAATAQQKVLGANTKPRSYSSMETTKNNTSSAV